MYRKMGQNISRRFKRSETLRLANTGLLISWRCKH